MKRLTMIVLSAVLAIAFTACDEKSECDNMKADLKEMLGVVKKIGEATDRYGKDCPKLAAELTKIYEADKDTIKRTLEWAERAEKMMKEKSGAKVAKMLEEMQDLFPILEEMPKRMEEADRHCASDPKFQEAKKKWESLMK